MFSKFVSRRANPPDSRAASKEPLSACRREVISSLVCVIIYAVSLHSYVTTLSPNGDPCSRSLCSADSVDFRPVCNHNISPDLSPIKALSQMSTSVVEVWQPEEADPLVPLQVIFI